jgi:hypothetical protein
MTSSVSSSAVDQETFNHSTTVAAVAAAVPVLRAVSTASATPKLSNVRKVKLVAKAVRLSGEFKLEGFQVANIKPMWGLLRVFTAEVKGFLEYAWPYVSSYSTRKGVKDTSCEDWPEDIKMFTQYLMVSDDEFKKFQPLVEALPGAATNAMRTLYILRIVHRKFGKTINKRIRRQVDPNQ